MIGTHLTNLTKRKKEKNQINKITDLKGDVKRNTNEIHRMIRKYFENSNKFDSLEEIDKFLDAI
jgi:transcription termination factor NusB